MAGRLKILRIALALATLWLAGCSEVLLESKHEDGRLERVKVDAGESWEFFDDKPRFPYSKNKTYDDMSIMLKREMTF
jgi:hypothetical protein